MGVGREQEEKEKTSFKPLAGELSNSVLQWCGLGKVLV